MCRQHSMMLKWKLEVVFKCGRYCMLIIVYHSALKVQFNYLLCQTIFWLTWTLILYIWCFSQWDKNTTEVHCLPTASGNKRKDICRTVNQIQGRDGNLFEIKQKPPFKSVQSKKWIKRGIDGYRAWGDVYPTDFHQHWLSLYDYVALIAAVKLWYTLRSELTK